MFEVPNPNVPEGTVVQVVQEGFAIGERVLRRDEILDAVWGREVVVDPHTVDNFDSSLKRKLGWNSRSRFFLQTVRGVGYRWNQEVRK